MHIPGEKKDLTEGENGGGGGEVGLKSSNASRNSGMCEKLVWFVYKCTTMCLQLCLHLESKAQFIRHLFITCSLLHPLK